MKIIDAQKKIISLNFPVLQTQDVCGVLNVDVSHASKILERLEKSGIVKKVMRGKWMLSTISDPVVLAEFLTRPYPSYISLQSALYFHGMISQIPEVTYAVSLSRTKRYKTPIGIISIHHIQSEFFFGYSYYKNTLVKLASAEKALIDVLYLTPARSNLFKSLPELEIPKNFSTREANKIIKKIPSERVKTLVKKRFSDLMMRR